MNISTKTLLGVVATVAIFLALTGPAQADSASLTVDGVTYSPTKSVGNGPTNHYETPGANPSAAVSDRHEWTGNGSENLPCEGGIHWIDNANVLTISHCLDVPETSTVPPQSTVPETTTIPESTTVPETTTIPEATTEPPESTTVPGPTTVPPESTTIPEATTVTPTTSIPQLAITGPGKTGNLLLVGLAALLGGSFLTWVVRNSEDQS